MSNECTDGGRRAGGRRWCWVNGSSVPDKVNEKLICRPGAIDLCAERKRAALEPRGPSKKRKKQTLEEAEARQIEENIRANQIYIYGGSRRRGLPRVVQNLPPGLRASRSHSFGVDRHVENIVENREERSNS